MVLVAGLARRVFKGTADSQMQRVSAVESNGFPDIGLGAWLAAPSMRDAILLPGSSADVTDQSQPSPPPRSSFVPSNSGAIRSGMNPVCLLCARRTCILLVVPVFLRQGTMSEGGGGLGRAIGGERVWGV